MIMMKASKLAAAGLLFAGLGFTLPANAATTVIDVGSDGTVAGIAEITCDASNVGAHCLGYVGTLNSPQIAAITIDPITPTQLNVPWFENADFSDIATWSGSSSPATETTALELILGVTLGSLGTGVQTIITGDDIGFMITQDVLYWGVKFGNGIAFFKNLAVGNSTNFINYEKLAGGFGLSHIFSIGGTLTIIPLPAALPIFLLMLGGTALVARRRRGVTGAA